jgi:hypothetical protein
MDALDLFRSRYDAVHGPLVDDLFRGLSDDQARRQPHGLNSVAWLVWHVARVQDAVVSRLVADRPQVLDEGGWNPRLRLDRRDVGPGMTAAEVADLGARVDLAALRGYHAAVAARTAAVAAALPAPGWDEVVEPDRVRRVVAEERLLVEAGRWVGDFWAGGRARGWLLLQVGLLHPYGPYGHRFDALATRGQLGA